MSQPSPCPGPCVPPVPAVSANLIQPTQCSSPKPHHSQLPPVSLWSLRCVARGCACSRADPAPTRTLRLQSGVGAWPPSLCQRRAQPAPPAFCPEDPPLALLPQLQGLSWAYAAWERCPTPWGRLSLAILGMETCPRPPPPPPALRALPPSAGDGSINPVTGTGLLGSPTRTHISSAGCRRLCAGSSRPSPRQPPDDDIYLSFP